MPLPRHVSFSFLVLSGALLGLNACGEDRGSLRVMVTSDMSLMWDIDWLEWQVTLAGHAKPYESGSLAIERLPATLVIHAGEDYAGPVRIRVAALHGGEAGKLRVEREALATLPGTGTQELWMPLNWLCSDANPDAACPEDETCMAGECRSLADAGKVGVPHAAKTREPCFNLQRCVGELEEPDWGDEGTCELDAADVNVALVVNAGKVGSYGACQSDERASGLGCLVSLDHGTPEGWIRVAGDDGKERIRLPSAVCDAISESHTLLGVAIGSTSVECPLKSVDLPVCEFEEPDCVEGRDACPAGWDEWQGYSCSGFAIPEDRDADLMCGASPIQGDPRNTSSKLGARYCCTPGETPSDDPLVIDAMSGGSQIDFRTPDGQPAGPWFSWPDDATRQVLFTYRAIEDAQADEGVSIEWAACLEQEQGFSEFSAGIGFNFTDAAKPLDVSRYRGIEFWASSKTETTIQVWFPNVDTGERQWYSDSTCEARGDDEPCGDHFASRSLWLKQEWERYEVFWSEVEQSVLAWGAQFDSFALDVFGIQFKVDGPGEKGTSQPHDFCVSQIRFIE